MIPPHWLKAAFFVLFHVRPGVCWQRGTCLLTDDERLAELDALLDQTGVCAGGDRAASGQVDPQGIRCGPLDPQAINFDGGAP